MISSSLILFDINNIKMTNLIRRLAALMLLISWNASIAQNTTAYINSGEVIARGVELHDAEDYTGALTQYQLVSPSDTNYAWSLSEKVLTYTTQGEYAQAIKLAESGLKLQSQYSAPFHDALGSAYDYNGEVEKALAIYKAGIERYPYYKPLVYNYGVTLRKAGNYKEAQEFFIRRLQIDPFNAASHLQLAELSVLQGFRTKAMLSYLVYMAIRPNDRQTLAKIESLLIDTIKEEGSIRPFSNNGFEEIDALIRSQFATKKAFKPSVDLDYRLTRHAEVIVKKLAFDQQSRDFWMQFYVPFFTSIKDKKIIPGLLYSIVSGVQNDDVSKWIDKNNKQIEQLQTQAQETLLGSRLYHTATILGQENYYRFWYFDDGTLQAIGNVNDEGADIGPYVYYYANGELNAIGTLDMEGNKTGKWMYYSSDGSTSSEETYGEGGNLNGELLSYSPSGVITARIPYTDGKVNGEIRTFSGCGQPSEAYTAVDNQAQGKGTVFDDFGNIIATYVMDQGQLNGPYYAFHPNGQKSGEYNYLDGQLNGAYVSYHQNGQIKEQGTYQKGELEGAWLGFYEDGVKEYTLTYLNGKQVGTSTFYHETGQKASVINYSPDGLTQGDFLTYDDDGVLFSKYTYENDLLKSYQYLSKDGKTLSEGSGSDTLHVTSYTPEGFRLSEATYVTGKPEGPLTYYHPNGNVYYTINIVDNQWHGTYKEYRKSGELIIKTEYLEAANTGWYQEYYRSGQVSSEGMVVNGNLEQRQRLFYRDGSKKEDHFYSGGNLNGFSTYYSPKGKVHSSEQYKSGIPVNVTQYDSLGNVLVSSDLPNGTGQHLYQREDGTILQKRAWLCGSESINYESNYGKGLPDRRFTIVNGKYEGLARVYHSNGTLSREGYYKNNQRDSLWTWYDAFGKISAKGWYKEDETHGKNFDYYPNGQVESECTYINGKRNGICKYYAPDGSLQYQKTYNKGYGLVSYQYELPNGNMSELKSVDFQGTTIVEAFFPNKKKSISQTYIKGQLDGKSIYYYPNGQIQDEVTYTYGTENGWARSYHDNGNLKLEISYIDGQEEGLMRRFREDGTLYYSAEYKEGVRHGYEIWHNSDDSVSQKLLFWNDVIY